MDEKLIHQLEKTTNFASKITIPPTGLISLMSNVDKGSRLINDTLKVMVDSPNIQSTIKAIQTFQNSVNTAITPLAKQLAVSMEILDKSISPKLAELSEQIRLLTNAYSPMINELRSASLAISKTIDKSAVNQIISSQKDLVDKLTAIENSGFDNLNFEEVIEMANYDCLEKQFDVIKQEEDSQIKEYLIKNHLMILSLLVPIVLFIWTCFNAIETSKQYERIISLVEHHNQTHIEILEEEKSQTKLVEQQTLILKELILDIKSKNQNQKSSYGRNEKKSVQN